MSSAADGIARGAEIKLQSHQSARAQCSECEGFEMRMGRGACKSRELF